MKIDIRFKALVVCPLLVACGIHVDYESLNAPPHALHARLPAEVEIYEDKPPTRSYVEVGTIDARRQSNSRASKEELFASMQEMAARHGCDAVKIVGRADIDRRKGYRGSCIVYHDTAVTAPAPAYPSAAVLDEAKPRGEKAHADGGLLSNPYPLFTEPSPPAAAPASSSVH